MRDARRSRARSRLRACERSSLELARTTAPKRSSSRARCLGPSTSERVTSKRTSTRLLVRFACWPPGPPGVVARHSISAIGMLSPLLTRRVPASAVGGLGTTGA